MTILQAKDRIRAANPILTPPEHLDWMKEELKREECCYQEVLSRRDKLIAARIHNQIEPNQQ